MAVVQDLFGTYFDIHSKEKKEILQYTFATSKGLIIKVISYGASISSIELPDKYGQVDNVVFGFDDQDMYCSDDSSIGSTVGRFGNRIKNGFFQLNNKEFQLTINNNNHHLHGGTIGWNKCVWDSFVLENKVVFSLQSCDGNEGYPGATLAQVAYSLSEDGSFHIDFQAIATKSTPINMTNHSYFNLAGHGSGQKGLLEHYIMINADRYLPVTYDLIPTGVLEPVEHTPFDLREEKQFLSILKDLKGLDYCFCIQNKIRGKLEHIAKFFHPNSARKLDVFSTEPGVQIYTSDHFPKDKMIKVGRGQTSYEYQGAFCCEPQNFPDAINHSNFPNCVLHPGEVYKHSIVYKLSNVV